MHSKGICSCAVPAEPEVFFEIFMGSYFHIAKFLYLVELAVEAHTHTHTHTNSLSYTAVAGVGDTLLCRYCLILSIPVR